MANTNMPFGFRRYAGSSGGVSSAQMTERRIASGNGTAIYYGDPVMPVIGAATGYITQGAAATTVLAGIFAGCEYLSTTFQRKVWNNFWPGSGASDDVKALVDDDPNAQFKVMGNGTTFNISGTLSAWTTSPVGQYAQFAIGTGNVTTHISGAYLDTLATTITFPFIVTGLITDPPGSNGSDPTTAYNHVVVGFNNEWMRTNGAGPLGIS
jgi:hypothetical protein